MSKVIKSNIFSIVSGGASNPRLISGVDDPRAAAGVAAPEGTLYLRYVAGVGEAFLKTGVADTAWVPFPGATGWNIVGPVTSLQALAIDDLGLADTSGGTFGFTLPAVSANNAGRSIAIKKVAGGGTAFTVTPDGTDTLDGAIGATSFIGALISVTLVSDGVSNWVVI